MLDGLITNGLAFAAGLLIGWNVLPQPPMAKAFFNACLAIYKRVKEHFGL